VVVSVLERLFFLLKTFERFSLVKVILKTVYGGEVLLKSRWVTLGLGVGPKSKAFQPPKKGNDSRKLECNLEVDREVFFFHLSCFYKTTFYLCTSKTSADMYRSALQFLY